jgi:hypothetical protein
MPIKVAIWSICCKVFYKLKALKFPVTTGMELPLEVEFFWIEHLLGAFGGPLALTLSGRFFFFEWKNFIAQ